MDMCTTFISTIESLYSHINNNTCILYTVRKDIPEDFHIGSLVVKKQKIHTDIH